MSSHKNLIAADLPRHLELLVETVSASEAAEGSARKVREVPGFNESSDAGLSLLELKNQLTLQYLSDLAYVQLLKASGGRLAGDPAVDRLVSARTVLEKLRPLEQKLRYQIDKALKVAESGKVDEEEHAKPNPKALASKFGDDDEDEEEDDEDEDGKDPAADGKYVIPKHIPAFFSEDQSAEAREEEAAKKEKKRLLSKSLIDDLRRQHLDTPEELHEQEDVMKRRKIEAIKERIRYEEDNFMRLPVTKKQRHARKQVSTMGTLADEVTAFGTSFFSDKPSGGGGKKRKRSAGGKKKKKFKK